jgi:hypothetical protein
MSSFFEKKFFALFVLSFVLVFFVVTNISIAQDDSGDGLPTTDSFNEPNVFLHQDQPQPKSTTQTNPDLGIGADPSASADAGLTCPYVFSRDLQTGMQGEDVRLLEKILNADKRTLIASTGEASPGQEGDTYTPQIKEAVRRFQILFKEWIGVANGRFGPRTRTVMNAICNGTNQSLSGGAAYTNVASVQQNATPQGQTTLFDPAKPNTNTTNATPTPLEITLAANLNAVTVGSKFKIIANLSAQVKAFTPESLIIDGGTIDEIRKLSKMSYSIKVTPNEDAKQVSAQVEADKVEDMFGNTNENASNEVIVKVKAPPAATSTATDTSSIDDLLNTLIQSNASSSCTYDQNGNLITNLNINGMTNNTQSCPPTDPNKYAQYDASRQCYMDGGKLPNGVTETSRCSNPNNPANNPYCQPAYQQQYQQQQLQMQQMSQYYGGQMPQSMNPCPSMQQPQTPMNDLAKMLPLYDIKIIFMFVVTMFYIRMFLCRDFVFIQYF